MLWERSRNQLMMSKFELQLILYGILLRTYAIALYDTEIDTVT
jgi:hypothetical protein